MQLVAEDLSLDLLTAFSILIKKNIASLQALKKEKSMRTNSIEKRFCYIYCITNLLNSKTYFGKHTINSKLNPLTDGYFGSGKLIGLAIQKYGIENFKKEIIISGDFTREEINRFEKCAIRVARFLGKAEYNLADGGDGGIVDNRSCTKKLSFRKLISQRRLELESDPDRKKRRDEKTKETKIKNGTFGLKTMLGKHLTSEQRKKISEKAKLKTGSKNSSFEKHWWTNGKENVKAEVCPEGFWKGRSLGGRKFKCLETGEIGDRNFWKAKGITTNNFEISIKKGYAMKGYHFSIAT